MTVIPLTFTTGNHTPSNFILTDVNKKAHREGMAPVETSAGSR